MKSEDLLVVVRHRVGNFVSGPRQKAQHESPRSASGAVKNASFFRPSSARFDDGERDLRVGPRH